MCKELLDSIANNYSKYQRVVIGFHNLKYDWAVISPYINTIIGVVKKDGLYYRCDIIHNKLKITFRDTYKLIVHPLQDFQKMFYLDVGKKEAILYKYYTRWNIKDWRPVLRTDLKRHFETEEDKVLFREICDEERFHCNNFWVDETHIDAVMYYLYYGLLTLKKGMDVFNKRISDFCERTMGTKVSLDNFLTISSFADRYFSMRGCYDGCMENQGNTRAFIQESVRGGICHSNPQTRKVPQTNQCDFDMVSMYPSAMKRIGLECGYPMGTCKKLENLQYPIDKPHYVVRIQVTNITKAQQIPLVSEKVGDTTVR